MRPLIGSGLTQPHPEMTTLLRSFPILADTLQHWPWDLHDPILRQAWATASTGQRHAIAFLLSVWDQSRDWTEAGYWNFNLSAAMGSWGAGTSVGAVKRWMERPMRP